MKFLLLLLASGLVTSDKLDHTYLPPPGSKYSGGTLDDLHPPLEFPKETRTEAAQNGILPDIYPDKTFTGTSNIQNVQTEISRVPTDYSPSMLPNDLSQTAPFSTNRYQSTVPTSRPVSGSYGSYTSEFPSTSYLPSKQSLIDTQSNTGSDPISGFKTTATDINNVGSGVDQKDAGYYYVPAMQSYRNGITNANRGVPGAGFTQFPNQINYGYLLGNDQSFIPRTDTRNDIDQNYQPDAFGFYGGNPMIMTYQNIMPQNLGLMLKYGENELNVPTSSTNQRRLDSNKKPVRPFQTPLVRSNLKTANDPSNPTTPSNGPDNFQSQYSTTTNNLFSGQNKPTVFDQITEGPVRSRYRQERPQADSERNAVVLNYENNISPDGYSYSYDTSNGIHADETGIATNGVRAKGSYSYTGDDGKIYLVSYTADENGFQPIGDHLPTSPPVPEAIKKVIEQAAKDKAAGIVDDGSYDERKYGYMNYLGVMDRYIPFKKSNSKSRFNGANRKPNQSSENLIMLDNRPSYHETLSNPNEKVAESPSTLKNININNVNKTNSDEYELNGKDKSSSENKLKFKENILTKQQSFNNYNKKPIISATDDQTTNREKMPPYNSQKSKLNYIPKNIVDVSKMYNQDRINQNKIPITSSAVTFTDDGYYYVPPIIKFNSNKKTPFMQNPYLTTNKYIPETIATEAHKRKDFDGSLERKKYDNNSTPQPINVNTAVTESTRQPYISGPNDIDQTKDLQTKYPDKNSQKIPTTYPDNLDSSLYEQNTTPMTSQTIKNSQSQDEDLKQYYQSTMIPTVFDQTLPSIVDNRIKNISSGNPRIIVSQDFSTTTYRPSISGDGVLEVNQNVKIYGLGKPVDTAANNGYPDRESAYSYNDGFYSTTSPIKGITIPGVYPDSLYTSRFQESKGVPNESKPYDNQYFTTGIPGTDSRILTGSYPYSGFDGQPQGEMFRVPEFSSNIFGNSDPTPGQDITAPGTPSQGPGGIIIGEDFSGPKQTQKFDPKTGYYYK